MLWDTPPGWKMDLTDGFADCSWNLAQLSQLFYHALVNLLCR